ncbi:MAG: hypothetical protein DMG02_08465 [Acidobacteria bacterium]|nr:MAG: hypothetical protein DMG02_08465 [Acidobacteriota bacterium]
MILGTKNASSSTRTKNPRCANCGSSNVSTLIETDRFTHGVGSSAAELSVEVPVRTCADCGTQFTDEDAERLRHDAVCQHLGLLTPSEIRNIRIRYGFNRPVFAALTKLGEATLARWESGATLQNAAYDQYLRLLRYPENLSKLPDASAHAANRVLPANVLPFRTPRLRAIAQVSPELVQAEKAFQLHP